MPDICLTSKALRVFFKKRRTKGVVRDVPLEQEHHKKAKGTRRQGPSLNETHQTTSRTVVISIQPQRVVEGQKARDESVRDNLPANALSFTTPSAK